MKVTNGEVFQAKGPLQQLIGNKFPVSVSFKLAKLVSKINEQYRIIDEVRIGLIKRYGEENGQGQTAVSPESEGFSQFVKEFNDLMAIEAEIIAQKVKLPDTMEIEPSVLMALDKFIEA